MSILCVLLSNSYFGKEKRRARVVHREANWRRVMPNVGDKKQIALQQTAFYLLYDRVAVTISFFVCMFLFFFKSTCFVCITGIPMY